MSAADYVNHAALEALSSAELKAIVEEGDVAAVVDAALAILARRGYQDTRLPALQRMSDEELARGVERFTEDGGEG